ncbi:MAG: VWA domain-containing protein [Sedimentisphaerales bacterium]|nr:VWA domain-containing protein [Sedimentisphaerales bacterium]
MVRSGGVTFWAWTASVAVHLAALTALGFVKFSGPEAEANQRPVPSAKINQVRKFLSADFIPKPKVKSPVKEVIAKKSFAQEGGGLLPLNQIFGSKNWPELVKPELSGMLLPSGNASQKGIEFFGSFADERKVCFVVDCSGSMQGVFGEVRKRLSEVVEGLQPDQYFYIIFFGGGRLYELGGGELVRATAKAKSAAHQFIESVRPAGRTNAFDALERASQIRDGKVKGPAVVYFLTDGFELTGRSEREFSQKAAGIPAKFASETKVNTIGFWPQSSDREMLREIAEQSGGEFILIEGY